MSRRRGVGIAAAALVGIAVACREPTQIEVELTTDVPCAGISEATIAVAGSFAELAGVAPGASAPSCDDPARGGIGSIVLVPSSAKDEAVALEVQLRLDRNADCAKPGARCVVARRGLRYLPHTRLTLPIALRASCTGVVCPANQTCVAHTCLAAEVPDPGACVDAAACGETVLGDGGVGASIDGGAPPGDGSSATDVASPADVVVTSDGASCALAPGAKPPSPGKIDCPDAPCVSSLCYDPTASGGNCRPANSAPRKACDEDDDCVGNPAGPWCCVENLIGIQTSCGPVNCPYHVCKTDCACPAGSCVIGGACAYIPTCGGACPLQ